MIFSDKNLAQKLERAEGSANAAFVEARAAMSPESGACWMKTGGVYAMFDGVQSPCTQTFGLGLFEEATHDILDKIEAFFRERGAPVLHEVCPLADVSTLAVLNERGYEPFETSNVFYLPLTAESDHDEPITVTFELPAIAGRDFAGDSLQPAETTLGTGGMADVACVIANKLSMSLTDCGSRLLLARLTDCSAATRPDLSRASKETFAICVSQGRVSLGAVAERSIASATARGSCNRAKKSYA